MYHELRQSMQRRATIPVVVIYDGLPNCGYIVAVEQDVHTALVRAIQSEPFDWYLVHMPVKHLQ